MEKPNLSYIEKLARGDESVRKSLIGLIKSEFPGEKKEYFNTVKSGDFKNIGSDVHRIKHKFSILGLENSYKSAVEYEQNLRDLNLNSTSRKEFENTLIVISEYLKTI